MEEEKKIPSEETYQMEEYSFDCSNCKFCKFMKLFGRDMNSVSCFVDCTKEIKAETDALFGYYLEYMFTNANGAVLYTGNTKEAQERTMKS